MASIDIMTTNAQELNETAESLFAVSDDDEDRMDVKEEDEDPSAMNGMQQTVFLRIFWIQRHD